MRLTGRTRAEVLHALTEFWCWADSQTEDGILRGIAVQDLSAVCPQELGHGADICPQFFQAMSEVGWLLEFDGGVIIPNFASWMGKSAKRRLADAKRKQHDRHSFGDVQNGADKCPPPEGHREDKMRTTEQNSTEQSRGMNSPTTPSCPETPEAVLGAAAAVLSFPCDGKQKSWGLTESLVGEWREAFPSLDVLGECRKALAWVNASPDRRKTARGMKRFLFGWLSRTQDRGGGKTSAQPAETTQQRQERIRREMEGRKAAPPGLSADAVREALARARRRNAEGGGEK